MRTIAILSCSVRDGRLSHRAAIYLQNYLETNHLAQVDMLDLKSFDFPLFHERLQFQKNPSEALVDFTQRFNKADAILIVTPVYNGSFSAATKNVIDLYYKEWRRKPVAVASATYNPAPGIATVQQVQTILLKLGAVVTPSVCTFIDLENTLDESGRAIDPVQTEKITRPMLDELLWLMEKTLD